MFYKCPNCGRIYGYGKEGWYQCLNCRYPLKKVEDVKKVKHPELNEHNVIGTIENENRNIPKCPTCSSTNVKKISGTAKVLGVTMFGLFSRTARSQFECKNCGYKW